MPSAVVDQMVMQVAGAMVGSVMLVVWLWLADMYRWFPFNHARAVDALMPQTMPQPVRAITAIRREAAHHHPRRQRAALRWATRLAGRVDRRLARHGEHTRRSLRRGDARELVFVV